MFPISGLTAKKAANAGNMFSFKQADGDGVTAFQQGPGQTHTTPLRHHMVLRQGRAGAACRSVYVPVFVFSRSE